MVHKLKLIGYLILVIMLLNLALFAFRIINGLLFWIIIVLGFVFVKWGLPELKKRFE